MQAGECFPRLAPDFKLRLGDAGEDYAHLWIPNRWAADSPPVHGNQTTQISQMQLGLTTQQKYIVYCGDFQ